MPKLRTDKPGREKIDWTKALILERRKALGMSWLEIAEVVGMSPENLRKMISNKPTWKWPRYTLEKILRSLNVQYGTYTVHIPEGWYGR